MADNIRGRKHGSMGGVRGFAVTSISASLPRHCFGLVCRHAQPLCYTSVLAGLALHIQVTSHLKSNGGELWVDTRTRQTRYKGCTKNEFPPRVRIQGTAWKEQCQTKKATRRRNFDTARLMCVLYVCAGQADSSCGWPEWLDLGHLYSWHATSLSL